MIFPIKSFTGEVRENSDPVFYKIVLNHMASSKCVFLEAFIF